MNTIVLVACVSQKLTHPAPAEFMYQSSWFLKARDFAYRYGDRWYILSAKYGLLPPDRIIEPYDKTLARGMSKVERLGWASNVLEQLAGCTSIHDELVFLAGQKYRDHLVSRLERRGYTVKVPMKGLRIGEQLAWLKRQVDNNAN